MHTPYSASLFANDKNNGLVALMGRQGPGMGLTPALGGPWPAVVFVDVQKRPNPLLPQQGSIGAPIGRWGGNQALGPQEVISPVPSPARIANTRGVRNIYGAGFANVPQIGQTPVANPAYAGAPYILQSPLVDNAAFVNAMTGAQ